LKKIVSLILVSVMAVSAFAMTACNSSSGESSITPRAEYTREYAGTTINVFNWGEYISDGIDGTLNVNKEFEKLTGIHVNYTTYESNEAMYSKLKSGAVSYDVVVPSDYMIERMISENMLQAIDFSKITNYDLIADEYKDLFFDPENKYSVPYNVGMVGLIYNTSMVDETPDSWDIMWDEKYKDDILMFDNPRDAFAIAQFLLGIDVNTTDKADWDKAADKLIEQNGIIQGRVMDQVFEKMEGGNAAIATYYAGDYLTMAENNEDLAFVYPKEGTNIFVDSICVPSNASNYEAAMLYINFLLEPDIALANAEYLCYASPNTSVFTNPDYSYYEEEILYPTENNMPKTEYFHDIDPEIRSYYEKLWEKVILAQ
jgi:spermidine/putrescine transport system substrate-binding protein